MGRGRPWRGGWPLLPFHDSVSQLVVLGRMISREGVVDATEHPDLDEKATPLPYEIIILEGADNDGVTNDAPLLVETALRALGIKSGRRTRDKHAPES